MLSQCAPVKSGAIQAVERDPRGRILPGASLNPSGRPAGSRSKAALAAQRLIGERAEELMEKAITMALAGDVLMLRALLNKLIPDARERLLDLGELPAILKRGDTAEAAKAAFRLLVAGELSPGELKSIIDSLDAIYQRITQQRDDAMFGGE